MAMASIPSKASPGSLTWQGLSYEVLANWGSEEKTVILHPQNGVAAAGELLALMGPPGSGKTSLLKALAGRLPLKRGARLSGALHVDGVPKSELVCPFVDICAYVGQEDILNALSSTRETLDFACRLRLPATVDQVERDQRIGEVLRQLGLDAQRETNLRGGSLKGSHRWPSSGERKRLSIALQMLHRPQLICLDEPTWGLDCYQASDVMEKLRGLAIEGKTVVLSNSQPTSSIFAMFHRLHLLSAGRVVYSGSTEAAVSHFGTMGYELPLRFNPADFIIDLVSVDERDAEQRYRTSKRLTELCRAWGREMFKGDKYTSLLHPSAEAPTPSLAVAHWQRHAGQSALFGPLILLLRRGWREEMGDTMSIMVKVIFGIVCTAIFSFIYFQMDRTQRHILDRIGLIFFLTMCKAFSSVVACSQVFPRQLIVFQRERANQLYSVFPFYLSCILIMVPMEVLPHLLTSSILFHMTNLGGSFWIFYAVMISEYMVGISLTMLLCVIFNDAKRVSQVGPLSVIFFLVFGGAIVNEKSLPPYLKWVEELSFVHHAFKAAQVNEMKDQTFTCEDALITSCVTSGNVVLGQLGFDDEHALSRCFIMLAAIFVVLNTLAFAILVCKTPKFLDLIVATPSSMELEVAYAMESRYSRGVIYPSEDSVKIGKVICRL